MSSTMTQESPLRPFRIIGFSNLDGAYCPECLRTSVPITGERVAHTCRASRPPLSDRTRKAILDLDAKHIGPWKIANHLRHTPATVLRVISGDADDDARCPACEVGAGATEPGFDLIPLYAADSSLTEECCTHCGRNLIALARSTERSVGSDLQVQHLTDQHGRPAIQFERRPPPNILRALHASGWRWNARDRFWVDSTGLAAVPGGLAPVPVARVAEPRLPRIRRRSLPRAG